MKLKRRSLVALAAFTGIAASLTLAAPQGRSADRIRIAGSSTVAPITSAVGTVFGEYRRASNQDAAPVTVEITGTGGGFKKFCPKPNDAGVYNTPPSTVISNASRAIKDKEKKHCDGAGIEYLEFKVAIDALTVGVNKDNTVVSDITFGEMTKMWRSDSNITKWSDIRPEWPDANIEFFRPGDDSGTFDYFKEKILVEKDADGKKTKLDVRTSTPTNRVTPSEDDNTLVEGIEGNGAAIGFFGFAYYKNNADRINALAIAKKDGDTPVLPSEAAVNAGEYPFSRPLFIYVNKAAYDSREEVRDYVAFYLSSLMVDAGGTPAGVSSNITGFLNSSNGAGARLIRSGDFLSTIGYVSKPVSEYADEIGKL